MRQNKAARFNQRMMLGIIIMCILVLGCVYTFLTLALPKPPTQADTPADSTTLVITPADTL